MVNEKLLMTVAIVAAVVSVLGAGLTYTSLGSYQERLLTGLVTDTATVNLTIQSNAAINFTTRNITFGTGYVSEGETAAKLDTTTLSNENATGFSEVSSGFVLENIGNVNVSLNLSVQSDSDTFLGGTNPRFRLNVTEVAGESGSCPDVAAEYSALSTWADMDSHTGGQVLNVCDTFEFQDARDSVRIDAEIILPVDSDQGTLTNTITATAVQI